METENDPPVAMVTPVKDVILSAATPANALPRWLKKDICWKIYIGYLYLNLWD